MRKLVEQAKVIFVSLLLSTISASHAYDLNVCKSISDWAPAEGTCDSAGLLQGNSRKRRDRSAGSAHLDGHLARSALQPAS